MSDHDGHEESEGKDVDLIDLVQADFLRLVKRYELLGITVVVGIATGDGRTEEETFAYACGGTYYACLGVATKLTDELRFSNG